MSSDTVNNHRSNIKYELTSLFENLERKKEERVFKREGFIVSYDTKKGLLLQGRNPDIIVTQKGVQLPEEYTSVFQIPYEWIKVIKLNL